MEDSVEVTKLYEVALDQCMLLQRQVIELRALYIQTKEELEKIKHNNEKIDNI